MDALRNVRRVSSVTTWGGVVSLGAGISLILACVGAGKPHKTPDNPATPPPSTAPADPKKAAEEVKTAIANLTKEVTANRKDPKVPLRDKCNYFLENRSPDVTPEEVVGALGHSVGQDAAADAYIKWQLLSGISGKVDAKLSPKLVAAYRSAPAPFSRPGLEVSEKRLLDRALRGAGEADAGKITAEFQKKVDEVARANAHFLAYRNDLYARLPVSGDVILASLEDGVARASRGVDATSHMKAAVSQITTWSVSATPKEVESVASLLRSLVSKMGGNGQKSAKASFPPGYYEKVEYDAKAKHLSWAEGTAKFADVKALGETVSALDQVAASLANMKSK